MVEHLNLAKLLGVLAMPRYLEKVELSLASTMATDNQLISCPVSRLLGAGGKRLRSALVIAAAASGGGKIDSQVIAECVAVELVHLGSLVHDDIIDNGATRWSKPTINSLEGTNYAIVVGDYMLAKACEQAASLNSETATLVASTIAKLCEGESRELGDRFNMDRSGVSLLRAIEGKTAALFSASCQLGGMSAGLKPNRVKRLGKYGHALGMAFQLIDDLLDFLSSPKLMGKPVGNDAKWGIYTLPVLISLKGRQKSKVKSLLEDKTSPASDLTEVLIDDGSVEKTISEVKKYNRLATQALNEIDGNKATAGLINLPDAYLNWALNNLVVSAYQTTVLKFLS